MLNEKTIQPVQWPEFQDFILQSRVDLYNKKPYSDVTLISHEKVQFKAHKVILGLASSVFDKIFLRRKEANVTIWLKDIMEKELTAILQFIYLGQAPVDEERLGHFVKAAKYLQMVKEENPPSPPQEIPIHLRQADKSAAFHSTTSFSEQKNTENNAKVLSENKENSSQAQVQIANVNEQKNIPTDLQSSIAEILNAQLSSEHVIEKSNQVRSETYENSHRKTRLILPKSNAENLNAPTFSEVKDNSFQDQVQTEYVNVPPKIEIETKEDKLETWNLILKAQEDWVKRHGVIKGAMTECPECKKTFVNYYALKEHINYKHIGIKYSCNQCDYKATKKASLKFHVQSIHEGLKYSCDFCKYSNAKKARLQDHVEKYHSSTQKNMPLRHNMKNMPYRARDTRAARLKISHLLSDGDFMKDVNLQLADVASAVIHSG